MDVKISSGGREMQAEIAKYLVWLLSSLLYAESDARPRHPLWVMEVSLSKMVQSWSVQSLRH